MKDKDTKMRTVPTCGDSDKDEREECCRKIECFGYRLRNGASTWQCGGGDMRF